MKSNNERKKNLYYTSLLATPTNALLVLDPEGKLYYASLGQNIVNLQNLLVKDFQGQKHVQLKPLSTVADKTKAETTIGKFRQLLVDPKVPQDIPIEIIFGTRLQRQIWQELMNIPIGEVKTYSQIAGKLNLSGKHARAIGAGCGANRIAIVIPCHRAIGANKKLTGYRYGKDTKTYLLKHELEEKFSEIAVEGEKGLWL
ncbi:DNA repair methyltransferase [Candida orthopsilosis Co 90-125]|uniref:Methylated-DNA--protein-cysteine methyltransferase n=1 Tax=Candida orthopsilosis (strain 90-125) TaxID=1136231 RepID=H8X7B2_CANO9|nr:DNA repair methyltransferase [Candida orthopsilosis Co 90-125]CCG24041.1 DNA repair methyltransferase [Candida orthopsilosis Co 90-125]